MYFHECECEKTQPHNKGYLHKIGLLVLPWILRFDSQIEKFQKLEIYTIDTWNYEELHIYALNL